MREEKRPVPEVHKTESSIGNVQQRWLALFDTSPVAAAEMYGGPGGHAMR